MTSAFENRLKAALAPQDPGPDFTASVLEAVKQQAPSQAAPARPSRLVQWLSVGIAACLVAAITVTIQIRDAREREAGLRAKAQVLEALQVTSEKLNLAYRVVHPQPAANEERKVGPQRAEPARRDDGGA
jgi:hypothetical protein